MAKKDTIKSSLAGVETDAVPESPIFRNTEREVKEQPVRHVNGVPIPPELAHAIPYDNTDEGLAEIREKRTHAMTEFLADPVDKQVSARRDFLHDNDEPWMAPDPLKEVADAHVQRGMRPKFLSPSKVDREGTRGWKPVAGKNGDPIRLGNLILAEMPEEKARARNRHYEGLGQTKLAEIQAEHEQEQARLVSDGGIRRSSAAKRLSDPDNLDSGLHQQRGDSEL